MLKGVEKKCAEDLVVEALGGNKDDVVFTVAVHPRNQQPLYKQVPVCKRCEGIYRGNHFLKIQLFFNQVWNNHMWELERINWEVLKLENAEKIPKEIISLIKVGDNDTAENIYWRLEFCLIDHGKVNHDTIFVIPSIINALQEANAISRQYFIELLVQISSSIAQDTSCNKTFKVDCLNIISKGAEIYLYYLENCTEYELDLLIELLGRCVEYDSKMKDRVIWYMRKLINNNLKNKGIISLISSWIEELSK